LRGLALAVGSQSDSRSFPLKEALMRRVGFVLAAFVLASAAAADEPPTKPPEMSTVVVGPGPTAETLRQKQLQWERVHAPSVDASAVRAHATIPVTKPFVPARVTSIPLQGPALTEALARQQAKMAASTVPAAAAPRSALAPKAWSPHVDKPAEKRTIQAMSEADRSVAQRAKAATAKRAPAAPEHRGKP
jgi:hypothetical protein